MSTINDLLKKIERGFEELNFSSEHKSFALNNIELWLSDPVYNEYIPQIEYLAKKENWKFLFDSFYQIIPFGTGGRRGMVGIGTNRINKWTIQSAVQGHSQYLIEEFGDTAKDRGVVLAYDVRNYFEKGLYDDEILNPVQNLSAKDLAEAATQVYVANGIKVYLFDGVRSTPELSFAIRYLNAIAGNVFSASHNLPTDNGQKIYDQFGGQLIPPNDQKLVDKVTKEVKDIKVINFEQAKNSGLLNIIGKEVDDAYIKAVCNVSLSSSRDIKTVYSPLHGTGLTSCYEILKKIGFDIILDSATSNLSGKFENVTFNIPNPEVVQSFDTIIPFAENNNADLILSSDPDADRIGVLVKTENKWRHLNGNEIGIILAEYAIKKYKERGLINKNSLIIKTEVTASLIERIAKENGVNCISDLLVGFKYIGEIMNKLEKQGTINDFILGTEESHGYIMGDYARDKDAAPSALWICELAAELKKDGNNLVDYLNNIYSKYGYCCNCVTEIRMLGASGKKEIDKIMKYLRGNDIDVVGRFKVERKIDRWDGDPQPHLSETDTSSRNVLNFTLAKEKDTQSIRLTVRPSGTEPKIKFYIEVVGNPFDLDNFYEQKNLVENIKDSIKKEFMSYCYNIIGVDFPDRGFLLFEQLPLSRKLKYFEIENDIVALKKNENIENRKTELYKILEFLGSNSIEKVDKAFAEKYKKSILDYLEIR